MLPIIGIAAAVDGALSSSVRRTYVSAIEESGGIGVIIPYTESEKHTELYAHLFDGFIFIGGGDIDPARYGEADREKCDILARRDEFELSLFGAVLPTGKPVMGICRGLQLINVALGGTLIRDIAEDVGKFVSHSGESGEARHKIISAGGYPPSEFTVNSLHHQGVGRLGHGLEPLYFSEDGITEAVRHPTHPYLYAYQWHPEREKECPPCGIKLFYDFISACKARMDERIRKHENKKQ